MGKKFYHKGDITKKFEEGQQPEGWVRGYSKKTKDSSIAKMKSTCMKKYGVGSPAQSDEIKKRIKDTNIKKFGVGCPFQSDKIKEKIKETNIKKYGVENPFQSKEIKEKIKETNIKKYGVEYPIQNEFVKEKSKQTNIGKYGVSNSMQNDLIQEKVKQTNLERYGVENVFQCKEIKEKVKQTNLERYGVENVFQCKEIKDRIKQTNLKRYGVEYSLQSGKVRDRIKQTNLERYGVEYPSQDEQVKEKVKGTNLEKYNTQWFCNTTMCTSSKKNPNHSYSNNSFKDLLDSMKINYVEEFPVDDIESGTSYRYDFKVGKYLIELDSTAYHNSYKHPFNKPKDKLYHQKKSKFAYEHGFICIHIFDWNDPEEVLSCVLRGSSEISGFVEPRLFLYSSKEDRVIKYYDGLDVSRLVEEGYLPVYDDGAILKNK